MHVPGKNQHLYLDEASAKLLGGQIITFWAKDPTEKREVFIDGKKIIYVIPGLDCDPSIEVTLTSRLKKRMATRLTFLSPYLTTLLCNLASRLKAVLNNLLYILLRHDFSLEFFLFVCFCCSFSIGLTVLLILFKLLLFKLAL